jgi:hypothetical protein
VCGGASGIKRGQYLDVSPLCHSLYRYGDAKCAELNVARDQAMPRHRPITKEELRVDPLLSEESLFVSDPERDLVRAYDDMDDRNFRLG